jgi:hypothetical protein
LPRRGINTLKKWVLLAEVQLTPGKIPRGFYASYRRKVLSIPIGLPLTAVAAEDNRAELRRTADEFAARATPGHPDCQDAETEWVNSPLAKPTFAKGSVEWQHQQEALL